MRYRLRRQRQSFIAHRCGRRLSFGYQAGSNRLNQVGAWAYTSDTAGNLTGVNGAVVTYGVNNRMIRVADSNSTVTGDYVHNGLGQRASKVVGGKLTVFVYDLSGNLILEYDWTTQAITEHVYGPSGRLVTVAPDGSIYWHHNDHLGTPQAMTDSTGKVVWTMSQTPFGIATVNEDPDGDGIKVTNNFRFPGQYFDAETGVNYNYFRTYVPAFGRYTQHDPIGLDGGMNPFGYAGGNPVLYIDPNGQFKWLPAAIGAVVGGVTGGIIAAQQCQSVPTGVAVGAIAGATAGFALSTAPTIIIGAVAGGGADIAVSVANGQSPNTNSSITSAFLGAWAAGVGAAATAIGAPVWWSTFVTGGLVGSLQLFDSASHPKNCGCKNGAN